MVLEDRSSQVGLIAGVAFALLMSKIDSSIVNISLPVISRDFHITTGEASWIIISYLLILTCTLLLFGKICDLVNVKKFFITGYVVFVAGSLFCGLSANLPMLVASRVIQALGGAVLNIGAYAIVSKFLPPGRLGWAFGILTAVNAVGVSIGAPIGGFITVHLSWQWIFFINIPIGCVAILQVIRAVPKDTTEAQRRAGIDYLGAVLSMLSLLSFLMALNLGSELGWLSVPIVLLFLGFVVFAFFFIFVEKRVAEPLVHLSIFADRGFLFTICATVTALMILSGIGFLMPFYLELVKGMTADKVGLFILVFTGIFAIVSSAFAGKLSDRIMPAKICAVAVFSVALASLFFSSIVGAPGYVYVTIFFVWMGASLGFFMPSNNNQVMRKATSETKGEISGLLNTSVNLSFTLGICIFETIYSLNTNILHGFRNAFIFGAITCGVAMVLSLASIKAKTAR